MKEIRSSSGVFLIALCLLATSRDAQAYIDPGSSSYLFQLLIGGLTALVFFFSSIKRKVLQWYHGIFHGKRPAPEPAPAPAADPVSTSRDV